MKDKTKAKIQELVPEVMELKFGCSIAKRGYTMKYIGADNGQTCFLMDIGGLLFVDKVGDVEILGSPITLAVVLRAIYEAMEIKRYLTKGYFSGDRINPYEANILDAVAFWDPKHDNYDDQTQETKDFLATLLS